MDLPLSAERASGARRAVDALLALSLALAGLGAALVVLDYPTVETYQAPHVKKLRLPHQDNVQREEGYARFHANAYGLIGPEPAPLDARDVYRAAIFGDSFVEALQVPAEQSMSGWLGRLLKPPPGYRALEVWNFGYAGDNTANAFARWLQRPQGSRFQLVIVAFNAGDVFGNYPEHAAPPYGPFLTADGRGAFALDESHMRARRPGALELWVKSTFGRLVYSAYVLDNRIRTHIADKLAKLRGAKSPPSAEPEAPASAAMIADTCRQLLFVRAAIAATGSQVILAGLPASEPVLEDRPDPTYAQLVACLRAGAPIVVDPLEALQHSARAGRDPFRDWNQPGGHYNALGHRIVAEAIRVALTPLPTESLR